jgi:hypothetical protein
MDSSENDEKLVIIGPRTYEIADGGGIKICGARRISIEGCTITPAPDSMH